MIKWMLDNVGSSSTGLFRLPSPGLANPVAVFSSGYHEEAELVCLLLTTVEEEKEKERMRNRGVAGSAFGTGGAGGLTPASQASKDLQRLSRG